MVATLNIPPACILSVLCPATVTANFGSGPNTKNNTYSAGSLGIHVTPFFGPSAHSATPHWIYEVQIPLLVNPQTDPFYFQPAPAGSVPASLPQCPNHGSINQISGVCNAFDQTNPPNGFPLSSRFLGIPLSGWRRAQHPNVPSPEHL